MSNLPFKLVVGGDVQAADGGYIRRPADDQLFEACLANEFSYVLACRQIGKSSLKNAIAERLIEKGVRVARIDLNRIGQSVSKADDWYFSLLDQIADNLAIAIDVDKWWEEQSQRSTLTQRFLEFFDKVILREIAAPIVIFIDEIDMTLGLPFTDDFFAAIRSIHNDRAQNRNYHRLTFVLLGVATPDDLIDNPNRTPFNIGRAIPMRDFTLEECAPFQTAITATHLEHGSGYLEQIYNWTNGHPYLLQKLCAAVAAAPTNDPNLVAELVQKNFLSKDKLSESNLDFVQTRVLNDKHMRSMLKTYRSILKEKLVPDNQKSLTVNRLKLYGLAKVENGYLQVRNRIYAHIFNEAWVRNHTKIDWTRVALIASMFVTMLAIGIIAFDYWVETEKNEAYTSFYRTDSPAVRLTHLAHIFQFRRILGANDYDNLAREMFFGLPREEQLALFDPYLIHAQPDELLTVIEGLYINLTDVDGTGSTTPLLEQMVKALRVVSDADQHLSTWQTRWYSAERFILRQDIVAERHRLKEEIGHWLTGRTLFQQSRREHENALTAYDQAVALNQDNPAILYERAVVLSNLGRYDEALSDLDQVIGIARLVPTPTPTVTSTPSPLPTATILSTVIPTRTPPRTRTRIPIPRTEPSSNEESGGIIPFVAERFTPTATATLIPTATPTPRTFSSAFINTSQRVGAVRGLLDQHVQLAQLLYENAEQYQNLVDFRLIPTATNTPVATQTPTVTPTPTATRLQLAAFDPGRSAIALIRERGVIVAGVKADVPLFGFQDDSGEWSGFEIDLMRELARRWLGDPTAVDFVRVSSADRLDHLVAGDVDILAATMTHRKEREAIIDFSQTYYLDGQNILVRRDAADWPATDAERIQALNGKRIGAITGSTSLGRISEFSRENNIAIEIIEFEQYDQARQSLLVGQVDALTTDHGILTGLALNQPDLMLLLDQNFSNEPYGLGVRSGDSAFVDLVNHTLQAMKSDGTYDQLYEKWFCTDESICVSYAVEVLPGTPPFTFATAPLTGTVDIARSSIIDQLRARGYFVAGVKGDAPPFGYRNQEHELVGFEVALMREFALRWLGDANGVEFVQVISSDRIPKLITRDIDIIAATMTHAKGRDAQIDFSQTYFLDGQNILVRRDAGLRIGSDLERVASLNGKRIGGVRGSTSLANIHAFAEVYNISIEIIEFEQYDQPIQSLLEGAIDGVTTDRGILTGFTQQNPELVVLFDSNFSNEPYGLGLPQGDHRFRDLVNFTLQEMKEDGTYDQLYRYWFGINAIMQEQGLSDVERFDVIPRYWMDDSSNPVTRWQPYAIEIWPGINYFATQAAETSVISFRNDLAPMVLVPAGLSRLGMTSDRINDISQHPGSGKEQLIVELEAFYIDQHEVTNHQYRQCVNLGICTPPQEVSILNEAEYFYGGKYKNYPVVNVTWEQAQNYCEVFGKTLPTEAQWEKAARFTTDTTSDPQNLYPWGDSDDGINLRATYADSVYRQDFANPVGNYRYDIPSKIHGFTEPIISLNGMSSLGVLDMAGNVEEWTADCYVQRYYAQLAAGGSSVLVNPTTVNQCGIDGARTVRSSGYYDKQYTLTTVYRQGRPSGSANLMRGFRCVASAENAPVTRLYSNSN